MATVTSQSTDSEHQTQYQVDLEEWLETDTEEEDEEMPQLLPIEEEPPSLHRQNASVGVADSFTAHKTHIEMLLSHENLRDNVVGW